MIDQMGESMSITAEPYAGWQEDIDRAKDSWVVKDDEFIFTDQQSEVGGHPIRLVRAEADTGSKYVVVATPLGSAGRAEAGGPVLITVVSPWQDAWAFQVDGLLAASYVAERLTGGRWQEGRLNGGDLAALTLTVAHALSRQPAIHL